MMIIAVMIGALLMPAQVSAQNSKAKRGDRKVQIDKGKSDNRGARNEGKRDFREKKRGDRGGMVVHKHHSAPRPVAVHKHNPAPPPVVIHRHHPAPPPFVVHEHCNSDAAVGAAVVIGAAALISLLAN